MRRGVSLRRGGGLAAPEKAPDCKREGEQEQSCGEFSPGDESRGIIG
jgi:hypothetical protein